MTYLPSSFDFAKAVRFLFGTGILHSMEKATQLVQGTLQQLANSESLPRRQHTQGTQHHSEPIVESHSQLLLRQDNGG